MFFKKLLKQTGPELTHELVFLSNFLGGTHKQIVFDFLKISTKILIFSNTIFFFKS